MLEFLANKWKLADVHQQEQMMTFLVSAIGICIGGALVILAVIFTLFGRSQPTEGFYFTLLYEEPYSTSRLIRMAYSFFVTGYVTIILFLFFLVENNRDFKNKKNIFVFFLGSIASWLSLVVLAFPDYYYFHIPVSFLAVFIWYVFIGLLRIRLLAILIPILIMALIAYFRNVYGLVSQNFGFSVFQHLLATTIVVLLMFHYWRIYFFAKTFPLP